MKKHIFTKNEIITVSAIIILMVLFRAVILLILFIGLLLFIRKRRKDYTEVEQKPIPKEIPQDSFNYDAHMSTLAECEELIANDMQTRREADLRQFKGRSDVTKEEVAQYMFEQRGWDGIHERHLHLEEIAKVSNLNASDIRWIEEELKHKCCYLRDEEEQAVWNYRNEQAMAKLKVEIPMAEQQFQENKAFHKELGFDDDVIQAYEDDHKELMEAYETSIRQCDYDLWLAMKGYVK